ncbi:MAG: DUF2723 domain-containing protein, partial [Flavobacteriaceae bacterium]|nr:DUF2723 domain-containing protein [Flavobacteriaceae bacterium]
MQSTNTFKFWNLLLGWMVFAIALIVYSLTLEPTVSFWDAGEYISTSAKLQVGHPPGAPLYQMLGAFISLFAPSAESIAFMVNMLSTLASAFTVAFMFWSLSLLLRKITLTQEDTSISKGQLSGILVAAFFASTAFIFTDSFWFNAVEAEVYAMASCIMALLFYLGLLWQRDLDKPRGDKWLILIS